MIGLILAVLLLILSIVLLSMGIKRKEWIPITLATMNIIFALLNITEHFLK